MEKSKSTWIDCVKWLVRCEVLRPDHQTCQPGAHVEELAYTLRDGVLLCRLVNTLEPDCISLEKVHLNPQTIKCLCVQNIQIFLKACQSIFSIKDHELFDPSVLYDLSGFHEVLSTLSHLSNTPKALRRTSNGFHFRMSTVNELLIREVDQRRSWELCENASLSTQRESIRQDAIYEKLVVKKQDVLSGTSTKRKEKRDYIIEEIITNERSYLQEVLKTVLESFMKPLKTVLGYYDIQAIFGSLESLAEFHEHFYEDLQNSLIPENNISLGNVFLKYYEKFLMYGEYCANLTGAQELLKSLIRERVQVKYTIDKCQASLKNGRFFLTDMLVVPMQHVLKYRLLLDRLVKETMSDHRDYGTLQRAYEAMIDVNNYVNDVKRDREAMQTIEKIEGKIIDLTIPGNKTLKDFGRLHKDDELRIKFQNHKIGNRYVFVFDQVMLICKFLKDGTYACQEVLQLSSYKVKNAESQGSTRWGYQWTLAHKHDNIVYIIFARNEEHKKAWMKAVFEALDNIQPPYAKENGHIFNIFSFDRPTLCYHCHKSLKGLIMQGYVCQFCMIPAHKTCLKDFGVCDVLQKEQNEFTSIAFRGATYMSNYEALWKYNWFVGVVQRNDAAQTLCEKERGTFLVRISPKYLHSTSRGNDSEYAISMKTVTDVIHMKVFKRISFNGQQYYLSDARYFPSVVELVDYYMKFSLQENFERYNEVLSHPIGDARESFEVSNRHDGTTRLEDQESEDYLDVELEVRIPESRPTYGDADSETKSSPQLYCLQQLPDREAGASNPNNIDNHNTHLPDFCSGTTQSSSNLSISFTPQEKETNVRNVEKETFHEMEKETDEPESPLRQPSVPHSQIQQSSSYHPGTSQMNQMNVQSPSWPSSRTYSSSFPGIDEIPMIHSPLSPSLSGIGQRSRTLSELLATQGQTSRQINDDIEKFGEYVVSALKLVNNPTTLKEITKQVRKIINEKLDDET